MRTATTSALPIASVLVCAAPALAQAPVALVEEVRGRPAGIEFMDYVSAGKVIKLGRQDLIVLGYLRSCWHETITGGTVIVGTEQSDVQGGKVARSESDVRRRQYRAHRRAGEAERRHQLPFADQKPLADAVRPFSGRRCDGRRRTADRAHRSARAKYHVATLPAKQGTQRSFFDFATAKKTLTAGRHLSGRASVHGRSSSGSIPAPKPSGVPIISRLLRFPPAS